MILEYHFNMKLCITVIVFIRTINDTKFTHAAV